MKDELWQVGVLSSKLLWGTTKFLVKNAPKAIVTIAVAKRKLIDSIDDETIKMKKKR